VYSVGHMLVLVRPAIDLLPMCMTSQHTIVPWFNHPDIRCPMSSCLPLSPAPLPPTFGSTCAFRHHQLGLWPAVRGGDQVSWVWQYMLRPCPAVPYLPGQLDWWYSPCLPACLHAAAVPWSRYIFTANPETHPVSDLCILPPLPTHPGMWARSPWPPPRASPTSALRSMW
jgi:hypothetical protein